MLSKRFLGAMFHFKIIHRGRCYLSFDIADLKKAKKTNVSLLLENNKENMVGSLKDTGE